jgi:uncharacterized protein involved in propanediol utilization
MEETIKVRTDCQVGCGHAIAQHGELFQGVVQEDNGLIHRCLLSLPFPGMTSSATFEFRPNQELFVSPPHKTKALKAAMITAKMLGVGPIEGQLVVKSNIPEAKGYGSSTADCTAAVLAVADAFGVSLRSEEVAALVVQAEVASGNIMFSNPVLLAHREGKVLEYYPHKLPNLTVLGFDTEQEGYVDTLLFPPARYSPHEIMCLRKLRLELRRALMTQDVRLLGAVATASAELNEKFLPKPHFADLRPVVMEAGAAGISVAHSGTVAAILFDPDDKCEARIEKASKKLAACGIRNLLRFDVG